MCLLDSPGVHAAQSGAEASQSTVHVLSPVPHPLPRPRAESSATPPSSMPPGGRPCQGPGGSAATCMCPGGGRVGSLRATLPAAGGGREVRGRGMGPGCARESVYVECGV